MKEIPSAHQMNSYSSVQYRFTDKLREFTIFKGLESIKYEQEFGRKFYKITIESVEK